MKTTNCIKFTKICVLFFLLLMVPNLAAADQAKKIQIGNDYYSASSNLRLAKKNIKDAFLLGEYITVNTQLDGELHALGRVVVIENDINGEVYAAAQDIIISNEVSGDVSLIASDIKIHDVISGDLRAVGKQILLDSAINGNVSLVSKSVVINSLIQGDVVLIVDEMAFGPEAIIKGTVTIFKNPRTADTNNNIPSSVISPDRIIVKPLSDNFSDQNSFWNLDYAWTLLAVALIAALIASIMFTVAPKLYGNVIAVPKNQIMRHIMIGFISISALVGSIIVLGVTILGLILVPLVFISLIVLLLLAPLPGSIIIGIKLKSIFGFGETLSIPTVFLTTFLVINMMGYFVLIPVVGWILMFLLILFGIGVIASRLYYRRSS